MKLIFTLLFVIIGVISTSAQGTLVEDTIILHLDFDDINDILIQNNMPLGVLPTNYEVDVHRVIYNTPNVHGNPTTASGLICLPTGDTCAMPMMAYLHGTKIKKSETFYYLNGEWSLGVLSATHGYAMCLPDYLGLGPSPGIHPYQHARSEATASVDIFRACRIICEEEGRELNDQLFLVGYSQGGHSVMATHRMIQEELANEFTVTASAPGSGPYDMSGAQLDMVASFDPYSVPGYLPYLIQSYQYVYGNLYDSIQQIYVPPYDQTLPPLLDGSYDMFEVDQAMPPVPRDIIRSAYADGFFSDTLHPAFLALKDNDVYNWVPNSPVMFNYCRSDEQVTYMNTVVASNYMISNGAPDIQVVERDSVIGHFECATPSILFSKLWFDTMAEFCSSNVGIVGQNRERPISFYPNPNNSGLLRFESPRDIMVRIMEVSGKRTGIEERVSASGTLDVSHLSPGVYLISMLDGNRQIVRSLVIGN
jgi:pimeloyl-ACP methyl ester carboxylesterase